MTNGGNLEIEIKIRLASFTDYLKLIGHLGAIDREEHQHNAFFDTPDRKLGEAGYALRVRATNSGGSVTLKSLGSQHDGLAIRRELIAEISTEEAERLIGGHVDMMVLDNEVTREVSARFPGVDPLVLLQFRNTRQIKNYRLADWDLDLEIDKTEFADGSVEYELEVELVDKNQFEPVRDALQRMLDPLLIPFEPGVQSKFERALARM